MKKIIIGIFILIIAFFLIFFYRSVTKKSNTEVLKDQNPTHSIPNENNNQKLMTITSSAFQDNQLIPKEFSCSGGNYNPPLEISNIPAQTKTLALIIEDPDAPMGTWYHWVLYNIPPQTTKIGQNSKPENAQEGLSSGGQPSYEGPCPPSGTHHYIFNLYALDTELNLAAPPDAKTLQSAIQNHIIDQTRLTGLFSK